MKHRWLTLVAAGALLIAGFAGAQAQEATPTTGGLLSELGYPEIVITATDSGFALDQTEVAAGRYLVTLKNDSSSPLVFAGFVQLAEGKTLEDLSFADEAAAGEATPDMMQGPSPEMLEGVSWLYEAYIAGGPSTGTDAATQVVVDLPAGDYGVWTEDPFSLQPAAGMTVTGEAGAPVEGPEPEAAVTIVETGEGGVGYQFDVQGELTAGPQIVKVLNASDQPHFLQATQYPMPITAEQVMATMMFDPSSGATPSPDMVDMSQESFVGWAGAQSTGTTQWIVLTPGPGQVLLSWFIPDPLAGGVPHAFEGMLRVFDVAGA